MIKKRFCTRVYSKHRGKQQRAEREREREKENQEKEIRERKGTLTRPIEGTREMKKLWRASIDPGGRGGKEKERKGGSIFSWPSVYD